MSVAKESTRSRQEEILSVAQDFIQTRGYNGFSYRDLATAIGIKSASIHYHFPTKGDLGQAVAIRYRRLFAQALDSLAESTEDTYELLSGYVALFRNTLVDCDRLCMCAALAGEIETVPESVQAEVALFFTEQQSWLAQALASAKEKGEVSAELSADTWATTFLSALEGAMLVSRGLNSYKHFDTASNNMLALLFVTPEGVDS